MGGETGTIEAPKKQSEPMTRAVPPAVKKDSKNMDLKLDLSEDAPSIFASPNPEPEGEPSKDGENESPEKRLPLS